MIVPTSLKASLDIPSHLQLTGIVELQAGEGDRLPTVQMTANTGRPMRLNGFPHPVIIDVKGASFARNSTPIVLDHDTKRRVGHTTEQIISDKIFANGVLSSTTADAEQVKADAKNGFPFQVSVGANVKEGFVVPKGRSVRVNGAVHQGPVIVATKTVIHELSLLSVGADEGNTVKIAARYYRESDMKFKEWVASLGLDPANLTEDQTSKLEASWNEKQELELSLNKKKSSEEDDSEDTPKDKRIKAADDSDFDLEARRELEAAEDTRVTEIKASFTSYPEVDKVLVNGKEFTPDEYRALAIKEGHAPDSVELNMLRASRSRPTRFDGGFELGERDAVFRSQVIECSLARTAGVPDNARNAITGQEYGLEKWYDEKVLEASARKENSFFYLSDLFDMNIRATKMNISGVSRRSEEFFQYGLRANEKLRGEYPLKAAGPFSTLSVSNILENTAYKTLLAAFEDAETIWRQIAGTETVVDFKTNYFYRLTVNGGYQRIPPGGELKHGTFSDERQSLAIDTKGMMLGLDRSDMINDDLSAFLAIPRGLGRNAALALEFAVVKALLDATFYSAGTNQITDDFGIAGISSAIEKFRGRRDSNNKPILCRPDRVVVGSQDAELAEQLYSQGTVLATNFPTSGAAPLTPNNNPHVGRYLPLTTPILNDTNLTGMDGEAIASNVDSDQWFMLASPAVNPCIRVGFLRGRQTPVIESAETSFNTLGMQWRSYFDFGTGEADDEYVVKSTGGA